MAKFEDTQFDSMTNVLVCLVFKSTKGDMKYTLVLTFLVSILNKRVCPFPVSESHICTEGVVNDTANISYTSAIEDVLNEAKGVLFKAHATKHFLLETYDDTYLDTSEDFISMNRESISAFNLPVEETSETLKMHYLFVHEHMAYVTDTIDATQTSTAHLDTLRGYLLQYRMSLSQSLCGIRRALIASGYMEQVSTTIIEPGSHFWSYDRSIEIQIQRANAVISYGIILTKHLLDAYKDMKQSNELVVGMSSFTRVLKYQGTEMSIGW